MNKEKDLKFNTLLDKEGSSESFEDKMFFRSQWWLDDLFGVENMSTIELSHLRRITKGVIIAEAEIEKLPLDVQTELRFASYDAEIGQRWLWELYGIDIRSETNNEELKSRIKFLREQAHNPSLG